MNFKTNFNKLSLLGNEKIKLYFEDKTVEFVPPNIRLYLLDLDFQEFLYALKQTPETIEQIIKPIKFIVNNNYETFLSILKLDYKTELYIKYFNLLFPNLNYQNDQFVYQNIPLNWEEYDILLDILFISCGERDIDPFLKKVEGGLDSEVKFSESQKRFKELQEKIEKAKIKNKSKDKKLDSKHITIDQIVIAILYEFKSLTLEKVYDMNMFTILEFWKYISKIVDNQIQIVAAGNGNIKEFTYFIN